MDRFSDKDKAFIYVVAVVVASIIGLYGLPYLAIWLTPPKGCV